MTASGRPPLADSPRFRARHLLGWRTLIWTGVAAVVLCLLGLGNHCLWDYHEPYVGGIIREMASSGNWVVPTLNGHPYLEKPPLFYALGALCCKLFGTLAPWALRLPSALLAMATVAWTSFLGWRLSSARAGGWAGFMVASNVLFLQLGHMAVVDMALTATVTLSLGLAFLAMVERNYRKRWVPLFWASLGLAFLAKGVFGPVVILLPLLALFALQRNRQLLADFLRPNWGMAAMLGLAALWVVPLARAGGRGYLEEVFVRNTLGRFLANPALVPRTGRLGEHHEPFYFYLARSPGNLLPWVAIWAVALLAAIPWRRGTHVSPRRTFLPIVFVVDLLFLSLSRGKRMVYLLPVFPITFVHAAIWLDLQLPKGSSKAPSPRLLAVLGWTMAFVGLLGLAIPWVVVDRVGMPWGLALALSAGSAALSVAALALLRRRLLDWLLDLTMLHWWLFLVTLLLVAVPRLDQEWRPMLEPFLVAHQLERQGVKIFEGRLTETQLGYASLEFQHVLPPAGSPEAVRAALEAPEPVALLLDGKDYWRDILEPMGLPGLPFDSRASHDRKLRDRAPALLLNSRAARLALGTAEIK